MTEARTEGEAACDVAGTIDSKRPATLIGGTGVRTANAEEGFRCA